MATPPLSDALVTRLASATAWRFDSQLGPVYTPRWFCCDSPNSLGLSDGKDPVAVIDPLSPNPAFTSQTVNYAGTASYDPDGSVTAWAWTFEGHSPASGTASSGTLNYATPGTYTIGLTVTDGTGLKSTPARTELVVQVAAFTGYAATEALGVFYNDGTANWQDKNTGLSGNQLKSYWVAIDPATQDRAEASKIVWRANKGSIHVSPDGGAAWADKSPGTVTNTWSDGTAPTVADLSFKQLLFTNDKLFALANWKNASNEERSWIFYTDDFTDIRAGTAATVTWSEMDLD